MLKVGVRDPRGRNLGLDKHNNKQGQDTPPDLGSNSIVLKGKNIS